MYKATTFWLLRWWSVGWQHPLSPENLVKMQHLGPTPDLLNQNLQFNKILQGNCVHSKTYLAFRIIKIWGKRHILEART